MRTAGRDLGGAGAGVLGEGWVRPGRPRSCVAREQEVVRLGLGVLGEGWVRPGRTRSCMSREREVVRLGLGGAWRRLGAAGTAALLRGA
jgi:hypothetical protein